MSALCTFLQENLENFSDFWENISFPTFERRILSFSLSVWQSRLLLSLCLFCRVLRERWVALLGLIGCVQQKCWICNCKIRESDWCMLLDSAKLKSIHQSDSRFVQQLQMQHFCWTQPLLAISFSWFYSFLW